MSIRIKIGPQEHDLAQADSHWIISQIKGQQNDNCTVCVQVIIEEGDVNLILRSSGCPDFGGGSRQANSHELQILDLWQRHGGKEGRLDGGEVIAFLSQLKRIL